MMSPCELVFRIIFALLCPPLSVLGLRDVGCGTLLMLFILTLIGYLPGQIAAIVLIVKEYGESSC